MAPASPVVCVATMARFPVILLCSTLISSSVFAFPKSDAAEGPTLLVRVEDSTAPYWERTEGEGPVAGSDEDCRRYNAQTGPAECAAYRRKLAAQIKAKKAAALAREKAAHIRTAKQDSKEAATRALSAQQPSAQAPKPLVPSSAAAPVKAAPGKTPDERLRHMVGQLVLTGFAGREPAEPEVERAIYQLRNGKLSGVFVRDSNIENVRQLRTLLTAINNAGGDAPALIAIEQPGGPDSGLSEDKGFAFYDSANAVSSTASPYEAQLVYRAMASELAGLGVTLNIGPSEDVCREDGVNLSAVCFGSAPSRIAAFARAFNFGHHDRGVLTALRHVPLQAGLRTSWMSERPSSAMLHLFVHGETSDALVVRVKAMQPLPLADVASGLRYRNAKAAGGRRFEFRGALIFEMDMGSGGAPLRYSEAILRAFQAGADMVMLTEPSSVPADISTLSLEAVQAGLKSGRLQMARIEDAYRHVQRLKARLRTFPSRTMIAGLGREP